MGIGIGLVELVIVGVVGIVLLFAIVRGISALIGLFGSVRSGHATITCPHCQKTTTLADRICQHCQREL